MASVHSGKNIAERFNPLSRVHQRYRQTYDRQTDGFAIAKTRTCRSHVWVKSIRGVRFTPTPRRHPFWAPNLILHVVWVYRGNQLCKISSPWAELFLSPWGPKIRICPLYITALNRSNVLHYEHCRFDHKVQLDYAADLIGLGNRSLTIMEDISLLQLGVWVGSNFIGSRQAWRLKPASVHRLTLF